MTERTAWRICSNNGWWSVFGKKRGTSSRPGPAVHDDHVKRNFAAKGPNRLWLSDITEHLTAEGKLYLCAIKDVHSNRIVGYSIDSRMKSRLAVAALTSASSNRIRLRNSRFSTTSSPVVPDLIPSSLSATFSQPVRQDSLIPKSAAICFNNVPGSRLRATRTTSSRNSRG
ncbi:DDE-type integrase/transposase/recombinase [Rhodococcus sp. WS3]|uniref:DDE-type integrase/transposase/recombinase n=1 Tax=Rhodococcus sp. WS3 TaxID=2486271 RepID=UPI003967A210